MLNEKPLPNVEDIALVHAYRSGDLQAGERIIEKYLPLVHSRVHALVGKVSDFDRQDVVSEGITGLLQGVRTYEPDKGASFKTYAYICISHRIINFLKGRFFNENALAISMAEVDETLLVNFDFDPQQIVLHREEDSSFHETLQTYLTELEYRTLLLFCSGLSYKEVAERLSIAPKSVDNAIIRCRRKLSRLL